MRIFSLAGVAMAFLCALPTGAYATSVAAPFVASRDPGTFDRSLECLTQAIYYEARNQSDDGQRAVAQVVLNRVRHPSYPASVCGVVFQGSTRVTGCQFSFTCDGSLNRGVSDLSSWGRAQQIARAALRGSVYRRVGLAVNYHTTAIRPYWAPSLVPQATVGAHIFYTRPDSGSIEAFSQAPSGYEPEAGAVLPFYAMPRAEPRRFARAVQQRFTPLEIREVPIASRQLLYRTYGPRAAAAASGSARIPAARTATLRDGPRVTMQGGVRVVAGRGVSRAN